MNSNKTHLIINSPHLSWASHSSSLRHLEASLSFTLVGPTQVSIMLEWRKLLWISEIRLTTIFWVKYSCHYMKRLRAFQILQKEHHFEILITAMWSGFSEGHKNNTNEKTLTLWSQISLTLFIEFKTNLPLTLYQIANHTLQLSRAHIIIYI